MKDEHILLILDHLEGKLEPARQQKLDKLIAEGIIGEKEVDELRRFHIQSASYPVPEPSVQLSQNFYAQLEEQVRIQEAKSQRWSWLPRLQVDIKLSQLLYACFIFAMGLSVGLWFGTSQDYDQQVAEMRDELQSMQETMVINLLEQPSATQRLKAVSMSSRLPSTDRKVSNALLKVLNEDSHVNVRLAALDALLLLYADQVEVREGLVKSIPGQEAPMVQLALAEAMVLLEETESVEALKQLMEKQELNEMVALEIQKSINALI
ncbi:HEAT repeat domain-containing protein [Porifericola rhodea]|uniref:HEAT repeat domain-containing protein n=1 Tax=Porifericola rhodea TaxID=930972 RepID=UPI00266698A1|nr:HEAT repeat domain-containing protein [Porifericola rhodea]WKN33845.1 HEAT repeat domain-containing protein [Porifericola rhodea]